MSVLKIDSSARVERSNSRVITQYLVDRIGESVVDRDLAQQPLPFISAEDLIDLHASSNDSRATLQNHLAISNSLIDELMVADDLVFGVPMYNFSVPAVLKQWIDYICRAGITFKYGENGPLGLTGINRAFIVSSSGGVPIGSDMDYASRYLEHICRFIGVDKVIHIDASGSKGLPETIIAHAKQQIDEVLSQPFEQINLGPV